MRRAAGLVVLGMVGAGLGVFTPSIEAKKPAQVESPEDLYIVDCLLPPRIRRLGRRSVTQAPRQPIKTTALECRIRGGVYTEPDQANLGTALQVWLAAAQSGDAEAQFYVGQIFEKGLGVDPDFGSAAQWYRKAAEQGYAAAQINLGSLYETGRGVEQDGEEALRWYRRAAGLAEDLVVLQSEEVEDLRAARDRLEAAEREVADLEQEVTRLREAGAASAEEIQRLEERTRELERQSSEAEDLRAELERLSSSSGAVPAAAGSIPLPGPGAVNFGNYHALVVGISNYASLDSLPEAAEGAKRIAETLRRDYGFEVEVHLDASRLTIMKALNQLRERLTPDDNLLVYYAGHATRDTRGTRAFWQAADADASNPVNWIPTELVTEHLDLVPARHVLVVADALFTGLRTRSAVAQLRQGMTDEERYHYLRTLREKRCRLVLTSGSEDGAGEFTGSLAGLLEANDGLLEASQLYRELVRGRDASNEGPPPEFASMRWARNEVADFFFVRTP